MRNKQVMIEINRNDATERCRDTRKKNCGRTSSHSLLVYRSNKRPAKNCRGCRSKPPLPPPLLLLVALWQCDKGYKRGCAMQRCGDAMRSGRRKKRTGRCCNAAVISSMLRHVAVMARSYLDFALSRRLINRLACDRIHSVNLQEFSDLQLPISPGALLMGTAPFFFFKRVASRNNQTRIFLHNF